MSSTNPPPQSIENPQKQPDVESKNDQSQDANTSTTDTVTTDDAVVPPTRPRNLMITTRKTYVRKIPKKVKGKVVIDKKTGKPLMEPSKPAYEIHHRCDDENSDVSDMYKKLLFRFVLGYNGSNTEGLIRMAKRHFGRKLNVWKNRPDIFIIDKQGKEVILRESEKSHVVIISSLDKNLTSYLSERVVKDIKYVKGRGKTSRPLKLVKCPGKFILGLIDLIPTILKKEQHHEKLSVHYEKMFDKTVPKPPTSKYKIIEDEEGEAADGDKIEPVPLTEEDKLENVIGTFVVSGDDSMAVMRTELNIKSMIKTLKEEEEKKTQKAKKKSQCDSSDSDSSDLDSSDLDSSDSDSSD